MEEECGRIKKNSLISEAQEENFGDFGLRDSKRAVRFKKTCVIGIFGKCGLIRFPLIFLKGSKAKWFLVVALDILGKASV